MKLGVVQQLSLGLAVALGAAVDLAAQAPPPTSIRVTGGGSPGRDAPAAQQPAPAAPTARPPVARPVVDPAAHDRGRAIWAIECVECHGAQARGSDTGPNIIRTTTVNYDRLAPQAGSVLGPFLKAGHPTQSKKPSASFTDDEIVDLANFLRQRVNDTMRGSPIFTVGDIVIGDAKAGEAFFNGAGGCATCHTASERTLAGIATRIPVPGRPAAADAVPRLGRTGPRRPRTRRAASSRWTAGTGRTGRGRSQRRHRDHRVRQRRPAVGRPRRGERLLRDAARRGRHRPHRAPRRPA